MSHLRYSCRIVSIVAFTAVKTSYRNLIVSIVTLPQPEAFENVKDKSAQCIMNGNAYSCMS